MKDFTYNSFERKILQTPICQLFCFEDFTIFRGGRGWPLTLGPRNHPHADYLYKIKTMKISTSVAISEATGCLNLSFTLLNVNTSHSLT